ncbi:hypothetical protein B0J18DRAFT_422609 [Chaetomium sp. MPI-SDFR-AT-0129]|nr:hypothetical protein B0J18DRAFT_422609 [Chaetomium sp. MPI-SDFR-AT-0129]
MPGWSAFGQQPVLEDPKSSGERARRNGGGAFQSLQVEVHVTNGAQAKATGHRLQNGRVRHRDGAGLFPSCSGGLRRLGKMTSSLVTSIDSRRTSEVPAHINKEPRDHQTKLSEASLVSMTLMFMVPRGVFWFDYVLGLSCRLLTPFILPLLCLLFLSPLIFRLVQWVKTAQVSALSKATPVPGFSYNPSLSIQEHNVTRRLNSSDSVSQKSTSSAETVLYPRPMCGAFCRARRYWSGTARSARGSSFSTSLT